MAKIAKPKGTKIAKPKGTKSQSAEPAMSEEQFEAAWNRLVKAGEIPADHN